MDSYNQSTVAVKYSTVKGCFLMVPEKWKKAFPAEPHVFRIQYGQNNEKEAYMSCSKEVTYQKDVEHKVFMNEKYAEKLGFKENEWVHLTPITSSIPKAERIVLEPLTSDDWEIMELNAYYIEGDLINQIRVIWTDQVFPIWVKTSLAYAKVVDCLPSHNPVILCKYSLVSVVPKDRYVSSSVNQRDSDSKKKKSNSNYLQFEHLRYIKQTDETIISNDEEDNENGYFSKFPSSDGSSITSYYASSFLASWFSYPREEKSLLPVQYCEELDDLFQPSIDCILRVLPYTNPKNSLPSVVQATTVFISVSTYIAYCGHEEIPPCFVAVLRKFSMPERKPRKGVNDNGAKNGNYETISLAKNDNKSLKETEQEEQGVFDSVCVTVMVMKSAEEDEFMLPLSLFTYKNAIVVPKELKRGVNLQVSSLVHLKSVDRKPLPSFGITLHPVNELEKHIDLQTVQEQFIQWAFAKRRKNQTFVISDGTLVKLKINVKKYDFFVHIQEKEYSSKVSNHSGSFNSLDSEKTVSLKMGSEYGLFSYKTLKKTSVKIGQRMGITITTDRPYLSKDSGLYHDINTLKLSDLGGVKKLSSKAIKDIEFWLKLRPLSYISNHSSTYCGCILICGPKGVGKTAFASAICKKFINFPYHVFVKIIQCLPLKGKRVEAIAKKWDDIISEAIHSQPSLVLFEDLDYIASSPASHEQENGPDGIYFAGISQAFVHMMNRIIASESKVAVIATSQSLHSLHSSLVNTRGRHIFRSIVEVNPPSGEQREQILDAMISQKTHVSPKTTKKVKLSEIAAKTEGYVAQDLGTLVDRATHAAWVRLVSDKADQITLEEKDFEVALKNFVPASLQGIALQMQDQRTWNDVGGLNEVKKVIQQIIMWPSKYKQIYKNYSLKPQTNILLYGAPGTGKTLLAGVVANECGLNFISIKGPELLSKYIGASEQAVRDLFKRATTARPCILFFDEFDSIAPRRGHDSTGVTDRVVNQLLTQLDGVESLEGVHVLAATSRPGLIDPALMRPGRLDKCLLCPLPDKGERKEILVCLSAKLPLSSDIDFGSIASLTENFSGADLQALLYTAHIEALHDTQSSSTRRYSTSSDDTAYSMASDKLLYIPTVEEGLKTPSYEDGKKIVQEVAVVQEKYFGKNERPSSKRNSLSVSITQRHLLKVASEMNPSVSPEERLRYEMIFRKFQNVLSGESSPLADGNVKRVTLA